MLQNSSDLYNGNIARMVTTITVPNSRAVLPLGNAYRYDQLNRLKHAVSFDQLNGNAWAGGAPAKYENSFTYDANGNILTQTRNDDNNQVIDALAYFYPQNAANKTVRNRLLYVSDNVDYDASDINPGMSASNYAYDHEGRLTQDLQEEIASIEWRVDGKVKRINRITNSTKQNLSFDYDAMGHRIAKHVYTSANVLEKSTYYVLDATGKQIAIYERNIDENTQSVAFQLTERTIYGTTRLGSLNKTMNLLGSAGTATYVLATVNHAIGKRSYELANHLGSVITVVSDKVIPHPSVPVVTGSGGGGSTVDYWLADIMQSSDFSPFGVQLENRTLSKNGVTDFVRFGYQGSEIDKEVKNGANSYTTFFRQLDPRLGRWMSLDPVFQPHQSPYNSMDNNPIVLNDVLGNFTRKGGDPVKRAQRYAKRHGLNNSNSKLYQYKDGSVGIQRTDQDEEVYSVGIFKASKSYSQKFAAKNEKEAAEKARIEASNKSSIMGMYLMGGTYGIKDKTSYKSPSYVSNACDKIFVNYTQVAFAVATAGSSAAASGGLFVLESGAVSATINGGVNLGGQLIANKGDFRKVDVLSVGFSTASGFFGGNPFTNAIVTAGADAMFDYSSEKRIQVAGFNKNLKVVANDMLWNTIGNLGNASFGKNPALYEAIGASVTGIPTNIINTSINNGIHK